MVDPSLDDEVPSLRALLVRLGSALFTLVVGFAFLAWVARRPLEAFAGWFVDTFGLVGLGAFVLLVDTLPLTHEPVLFLGLSGGLGFWPVCAAGTLGSIGAGIVGWLGGRVLGRQPWLQSLFERYRITAFLRRYGAWAVAVAALTPFPYAVTTWASGAANVPLRLVVLGSLMRGPKVLLYLSLIAAGWYGPMVIG